MHTGSSDILQNEGNPGAATGPAWQYPLSKTRMEIWQESYINLEALFTFDSNIWCAYIHLYLDKPLALLSQRLIAVLSAHLSPKLGSTFHLDVVHRSLKDLATLTSRGQLVSAADLSFIISIPNTLGLW